MKSLLIKKTISVLATQAAVVAICLGSSAALAVSVVPGTVCQKSEDPVTGAGSGGAIQYFYGSASAVGNGNIFNCPIPNGTSNGTSVRFRMNVTDDSATDNVSCQFFGIDINTGNNVLFPTFASSSISIGTQILDVTKTVPTGYSSTDLVYYAECSVPDIAGFGLISGIHWIRID